MGAAAAPTPALWAQLYLGGSLLAALLSLALLKRDAPAVDDAAPLEFNYRDGLRFAGGVMSVRIHTEADKTLVLGLSGALGAGLYAAAYRIVEFTLLPMVALLMVLYAQSFSEADVLGQQAAARRRLRFTLICAAFSVAISVAAWFLLVPVTRFTMGVAFAAVADGIAPLTLLPIAMCLRMIGEQNLATVGLLRSHSQLQWSAAALALAANGWVIPMHGWVGAAWVCLVTEAALGLAYLAAIARVLRAPAQRAA